MERVIDFAWKNRGLPAVFLLIFALLVGCGGKVVSFTSTYDNGDCQQLWEALEEAIHTSEVADNTAVRIQGFPYLRSNRYLEALAGIATSEAEEHYVLEEMRLLDLDKRVLELTRIPEEVLHDVIGHGPGMGQILDEQLSVCSQEFLAIDKRGKDFFGQVRSGIDLDRDYSLWLRSVGLYPLTSLVVGYVAANAQEEMVAQLAPIPQQGGEDMLTFRPVEPLSTSLPDLPELLRRGRNNPLLSLNLADQDLFELVRKFAPLLTIAAGDDYDRFGRIVRRQGKFEVDGDDPVVYYYFSQTIIQQIPALQINYVTWFPERATPAPWFEQGELDGIIFRVTLNWDGQPIFVDIALQCGCYHFVLFNADLVRENRAEGKGFRPTVGGNLPDLQGRERLQFRIISGRHQIGQVTAVLPTAKQQTYQLLPYEGLEYFEQGNEVISLFNNVGRVAGSNRLERFFLFPMGIPKVGAMRQRGRQPITLIGRAYFDDPYLFDNAFCYHVPLPATAELTSTGGASQKEAEVAEVTSSRLTSTEKTDEGSTR